MNTEFEVDIMGYKPEDSNRISIPTDDPLSPEAVQIMLYVRCHRRVIHALNVTAIARSNVEFLITLKESIKTLVCQAQEIGQQNMKRELRNNLKTIKELLE